MTPLHSIATAAELLDVSTGWLREQVRLRQVPHTRIGTNVRFTEEHLAEIIAAGEVRPDCRPPSHRNPTGRRVRRHPTTEGLPAQARRPSS